MILLGISLRAHDANISLSINNKVKYLKLEREIQIKHAGCINLCYIDYVLNKWNLKSDQVDAVAYTADMNYPFLSTNSWDSSQLLVDEVKPKHWYLEKFKCPFFRIDHHYAHTLSKWPIISETDIDMVCDALGDYEDTYSIFKNENIIKRYEREEARSIGVCLNNMGESLNVSGEWLDIAGKLMGLKSYGEIDYEYIDKFSDDISQSFKLFNQRNYYRTKTNLKKNELNRLASCHFKSEKIMLNHFSKFCNLNDIISYSGGVAQNVIINTSLKNRYKNLHIPPHSPDDGLSLGLIEFLRKHYNQPAFDKSNFPFWQDDVAPKTNPTDKTIKQVSELLAQGKIIAWYQGHGELGPRALGNRSILMNPLVKNARQTLNDNVKKREWFRPFGASILEEYTNKYFNFNHKSEYMLYVADVLDKDKFSAITHVDGTCRIQTVNENNNYFYHLLHEFNRITGIPMLINTSLNINGKPIASKPLDALELYDNSAIDFLIIGNEIYNKS
jgi:carbamoyltransferase